MTANDNKRMSTTETRTVRLAVDMNQHRRNEEILEEATVETMVMRRGRLEWFRSVKT